MGKLFLDDVRMPPDGSWDVVRSYDEFVAYIRTNGVPDLISFDHDLGLMDYAGRHFEKNGHDCAKWIVDNGLPLKGWAIHSMNPVGRQRIQALLVWYTAQCRAALSES